MFHPAIHLNVASGSFSESRTANSRKSKQSENIGKKISPWWEKFLTELLTRIYTAFILGKALQNFGPRANSFGHGPLDLHDKICLSFFNVDFWNGTPETRTALLNLWVPALVWQRFTCDSSALSRAVKKKTNIADSRVQKAIVWLVALKKWKRLSQLWDETRSSLAPRQ